MAKQYTAQEQHQNYLAILEDIESCQTEEELDDVSDTLEQFFMTGRITKKQNKALDELIDDRLSYLIEEGLI